jgi:hypothetical protein
MLSGCGILFQRLFEFRTAVETAPGFLGSNRQVSQEKSGKGTEPVGRLTGTADKFYIMAFTSGAGAGRFSFFREMLQEFERHFQVIPCHHYLDSAHGRGPYGIDRNGILIFQPAADAFLLQSPLQYMGVNVRGKALKDHKIHEWLQLALLS